MCSEGLVGGIVFTTPALGPPVGGLLLLVFAHGYLLLQRIAPYRRTGEDGSAVHDYLSAPQGSRSRGDPVLMQRRFQVVQGQQQLHGLYCVQVSKCSRYPSGQRTTASFR